MSNKAFTAFYDEVLPDVPGAPQALALNAIRNAAIEFCLKSKVWVVDHDPLSAIAGQSVYEFEPPTGAVVSGVVSAWFDGRRMAPTTQAELSDEFANWRTMNGTPTRYLQENAGEIILFPIPASALAGALTMKVSLKPSRASTTIDSWLFESYLEAIAHGAKWKLMIMPKKPWSDGATALYHKEMFDAAVDGARLAAFKGLGKAPLRSTARFI